MDWLLANVPALAFSATELMALLLTKDLLRPLEGTHINASLDSVFSKAVAALPPAVQAMRLPIVSSFAANSSSTPNVRAACAVLAKR